MAVDQGSRRTGFMPVRGLYDEEDDLDSTPPPIATRPNTKKRRASGTTKKQAEADPGGLVLSSMIESLVAHSPTSPRITPRHYEVVDGYVEQPRSQLTRSRLYSISDEEEFGAPSPIVGGSSRGVRPRTSRQGPRMTYGDLIAVEAPTISSTPQKLKRRSLQSTDSGSIREQNGLRGMVRTGSAQSRNSLRAESVHSRDSDKSSKHNTGRLSQTWSKISQRSASQAQPAKETATQAPQSEPIKHRRKTLDLNIFVKRKDTRRSESAEVRKDSVEPGPSEPAVPPKDGAVGPAGTQREAQEPKDLSIQTPAGDLLDDRMPETNSASVIEYVHLPTARQTRRRKSKSSISSKRSSPMSPIADCIPDRISSLGQAEKTPAHGEKTGQRQAKREVEDGDKSPRRGEKPALNSQSILEELGEEDDTVRRIRELKQWRDERSKEVGPQVGTQVGPQVGPNNGEASTRKAEVSRPTEATTKSPLPDTNCEPAAAKQQQVDTVKEPEPTPAPGAQEKQQRPKVSPAKHHHKAFILGPMPGFGGGGIISPLAAHPPPRRARHPPPKRTAPQRPQTGESHEPTPSTDGPTGTSRASQENGPASIINMLRPAASRTSSSTDKRRPPSLDTTGATHPRRSIEDEVETYLAAPRLNRTCRHPKTHRVISFSEVGSPNGYPVVVCVGMGLTRYVSAFYDELATTLNLRLITPERQGVGKSEACSTAEDAGPMAWHEDLSAILDELRITRFALLAHSAGAVFAMATALVLPHQVVNRVYLLAPWIPPSQFDAAPTSVASSPRPTGTAALPRSQRLLRVLPVSLFKAANSSLLGLNTNSATASPGATTPGRPKSSPRSSFDAPSPTAITADTLPLPSHFPSPSSATTDPTSPAAKLSATTHPTDPDLTYTASHLSAAQHAHQRDRRAALDAVLLHRIWAASTTPSNPAHDLLTCLERVRAVGFRYVDVRKRLVVLHGDIDRRVRLENVRWLVAEVERVRRRRRIARVLVDDHHHHHHHHHHHAHHAHDGQGHGDGHGDGDGRDGDDGDYDDVDVGNEVGGAELRVLPGMGHGLMAVAGVMADVLAEMAADWRERDEAKRARSTAATG